MPLQPTSGVARIAMIPLAVASPELHVPQLVDEKDPSIEFVDKGEHFHLYLETDDAAATADVLKRNGVRIVKDVHETAWGTREFIIKDDQGHRCTSAKLEVNGLGHE